MIAKLEQKIGKYAVKNLIYYILGAYVIGYILYLAKPEWYEVITLNPIMVSQGQVWRLFTWVCTVPQALSFFTIFMFLFYFFIGRTLEQHMGSFRYNLYIFSGWFFTTLGAMLVYWIFGLPVYASTNYINLTSFLAFAVLFPETRVLFFGLIPIRMKILAWIDGIYMGLQVISGLIIAVSSSETVGRALQVYYGGPVTSAEISLMRQSSISLMVTILISMLNFLIFFLAVARKNRESRQRREDFQQRAQQGSAGRYAEEADPGPAWFGRRDADAYGADEERTSQRQQKKKYHADGADTLVHTCEVCGRTNITNPELMFRYCSRCSGDHEYCQDHLFTHEHIRD